METVNISLPADLQAIIDRRVAEGSYASRDKYVEHLIRADSTQIDTNRLERLLVDRIKSNDFVECDADDFRSMRESFVKRLAENGET